MKTRPFIFALVGLLCAALSAQSLPATVPLLDAPQIVTFSSASLHLKGFLWKPAGPGPFPAVLFNHGSGGADAAHTAGMTMTEAAEKLGPLFVKHGYAFFYPCRRGQGLSADQAPFMQDLLQQEEAAKGKEARLRLQLSFTTKDHLNDELAALAFLKNVPEIDSQRIAVVGHSFGGKLAILEVERDADLRAAVTFAAAAESWDRSPELRERLLTAVRETDAPVMLIHAENDFGTSAGRDLAAELERQHKPHVLKIYPPVGKTNDDGHNLLYLGVPLWEADVFGFLDEHMQAEHIQPAKSVVDPPATREDIQHLFEVMHVRQQVENTLQIMMVQQRKMIHETVKAHHPEITDEQIAKSEESSQDFMKSLPVNGMLDDMIPVYQKHLLKSDVDAMSNFYASPTGQKLLKEQPVMAAESMQVMSPRLQKTMEEFMDREERKATEEAEKDKKPPAAKPEQRKN